MGTTGCINKLSETNYSVYVEWEIRNFLPWGSWIHKSPTFSYSHYKWHLKLRCDLQKIIGLFLYKDESESKISAVFEFGIRLKDGNPDIRCLLKRVFDEPLSVFGTEEFITVSELKERQREMLPNGSLVITCSIVDRNTGNNAPMKTNQNLVDELLLQLEELFVSKENTDVIINVGEREFLVHKNILTTRSTVFSAMFKHKMTEKQSGIIKVVDPNKNPNTFEDFLLFLYTGKVENLTTSNVYHMYRIADKYNVQSLKSVCTNFMERTVSIENLFDVVVLANQFNETELMSAAQKVFNENTLKIISSDDWEPFLKQKFSIANQLLITKLQVNVDD